MVLRIWGLNEMGRTWDEPEYVNEGHVMIELLKKGDYSNNYFSVTYDHPPLVKYLYGLSSYLDINKNNTNLAMVEYDKKIFNSTSDFLFNTKGHFDINQISKLEPVFNYDLTYSRLLSALMFSLGVVITVLIGWKIFSPSVGIFAGIILSMLPISLGLSQLVTTESLKILIYPTVIYSYLFLVEKLTTRRIWIAGILIGLALQAKQTDFLLIPLIGIVFFVQYRQSLKKEKKEFFKTRILALISIIVISLITFVALWPQVLFQFKEVYEINQKLWGVKFSSVPWQITLSPPELFFGRLMLTPIFYYLVYFFITIPLGIIALFILGIKYLLKVKNINYLVILLWFILPFSLSIYSWRNHGLRYIIEIFPAFSLIAAFGFEQITNKLTKIKSRKYLYFIPVFIYLFATLMYLKPYYLDYFNELVGGTGTVYKYNLFQTGWWGEGEKEAGMYINNNAKKGSTVGLALSPEHTFLRFDGYKYSVWSKNGKYDYVVVNHYNIIREGFNDKPVRYKYTLIHRIKDAEGTLVYIYKIK